jgi:hypothetical protein
MNEIGKSVGLNRRVDDVREIFAAATQNGYHPDKLSALQDICRLMSDCYVYNQATQNGSWANFPRHDVLARAVLASVRSRSQQVTPPSQRSTIKQAVKLPSLKSLLKAHPEVLLKLRSQLYPPYRVALEQWQLNPSEHNERQVRTTMTEYGTRLLKVVKRQDLRHQNLLVTHRSGSTPPQEVLKKSIDLGVAVGSVVQPLLAPLVAISQFGYSIYQWVTFRSEQEAITLRAHPELSLPAD